MANIVRLGILLKTSDEYGVICSRDIAEAATKEWTDHLDKGDIGVGAKCLVVHGSRDTYGRQQCCVTVLFEHVMSILITELE